MLRLAANSRKRRLVIALWIYVLVAATNFALTPRQRVVQHTQFNHFALLADAWLHGRLDLRSAPPAYAQNNDFAAFHSKWFVTFPPFPAVLLLPVVWIGKVPENVRDGQFFVWLSGLAPALLFLVLEKLRRMGRSSRTERTNAILALLFAFGTVYFFTALQGTVWFAAHIVGAAIAACYMLFALDAERPALAGFMIGLGFLTRTPLLFAVPLFVFEASRVSFSSRTDRASDSSPLANEESSRRASGSGEPTGRTTEVAVGRRGIQRAAVLCILFAAPLAACIVAACVHNQLRFGKPFDFGYEYLTVAWQGRMKKWGLFNYHFLARNLGVVLASLPWYDSVRTPHVLVNMHGLALWVTTPLYLWLVWPKKLTPLGIALYVTAAAVAIPGLLYQNTGWMQFGYRFSNDYAPILFALLAVNENRFGKLFAAAAVWSVAINAFGAITFDTNWGRKFYYQDASQNVLYQPD